MLRQNKKRKKKKKKKKKNADEPWRQAKQKPRGTEAKLMVRWKAEAFTSIRTKQVSQRQAGSATGKQSGG